MIKFCFFVNVPDDNQIRFKSARFRASRILSKKGDTFIVYCNELFYGMDAV